MDSVEVELQHLKRTFRENGYSDMISIKPSPPKMSNNKRKRKIPLE
jgi:hypothetical protein